MTEGEEPETSAAEGLGRIDSGPIDVAQTEYATWPYGRMALTIAQ